MSFTSDGEQAKPDLSDPAELVPVASENDQPPPLSPSLKKPTTTIITIVCDSDESDSTAPVSNGDFDTDTKALSSSAASVAAQPIIFKCVNNPDLFCYLCGLPCFITKRKSIRKSEIAQQAYQAYYGRAITNLDEPWTPNFFCNSCYNRLYNWYRDLPTGQSGMDFCEPMIWGKPNEDHSDCYFCAVPKKFISTGHKNRRDLVMPIMKLCVLLPRRTHDNFDVPEPPKNCGTCISLNANQRDVENDHAYSEDPSDEIQIPGEPEMVPVPDTPKPQPYTNEELQQLLADLQPLSTEQQEILVASLEMHSLVIKEVRKTRSRVAGKRMSYKFALASPISKRTRLPVKPNIKIEQRADDFEAASNVSFDMPSSPSVSIDDEEYSSDEEVQDDDKDGDYTPNPRDDNEVNVARDEKFKTIVINLSCNVEGCHAVLKNKPKLLAHMLSEHGIHRYICFIAGCNSNFKIKRRFNGHIATVHLKGRKKPSPGEDVYKCGQCDTKKKFRNYARLKRHYTEHHFKGSYMCGYPECKFTLPNGSTLAQMMLHIREEHKKKMFSCTWPNCTSGGFICQSALDKHLQAHNGVLPFACEEKDCGKTFASLHTLKAHIVRDHTGEYAYSCETCGKQFATKESLKKHDLKHGEPQYTCEICGKQYVWITSYKKHMVVHRGERAYRCPNCGKGFFWQANLKKHVKNAVCSTEKGRRRSYKRGDLPFSSNLNIDPQPDHPATTVDAVAPAVSRQAPDRHQKPSPQVQQPPPQIYPHQHQQQQQPNHLQHHHHQPQVIYIQPHPQQLQPQQRPDQMATILGAQPVLYSANQIQATPMYQMNSQFEQQQQQQQQLQQLQQLQLQQQQQETAQSIEMLFGADWNLN